MIETDVINAGILQLSPFDLWLTEPDRGQFSLLLG